jgi:hypothetical protein
MLTQQFVDNGTGMKKDGTRGGSVIWTRRPMDRAELEHVAKAVATASFNVQQVLDENVTSAADAESVLRAIESDEEFASVCEGWIKEAEEEIVRRQQIVEFERGLRLRATGT